METKIFEAKVMFGLKPMVTLTYRYTPNLGIILNSSLEQLTDDIVKSITSLTDRLYYNLNEFTVLGLSRKKFFKDDLYRSLINTLFFNKSSIIKLSPIYHIDIKLINT